MKKRIAALLLALVMVLSLIPTTVFADDHANQVHVIVENTTFTRDKWPEGEVYWDGTQVSTWVDLESTSTMMSCVVKALESMGYTQTGAENNYISSITVNNRTLAAENEAAGAGSGWMGSLNDWFTNVGFAGITVEEGTLAAGDEIRIMYTMAYGDDLGGSWANNDKTVKALDFSDGTLSPAFSKDVHDYTLTLDGSVRSVVVTPTASNKNFQVRTSVGETEYKRTAAVPVANDTVITVKCGEPEWPSMNNQAGGTAATVPAQTYTITVKTEGSTEPAVNYLEGVAFRNKYNTTTGINYAISPAFDPAVHEYTVIVPDTESVFAPFLTFSDKAPEGTKAVFMYTNTSGKNVEKSYVDTNSSQRALSSFLKASYTGNTVTLKVGEGEDQQTYTFTVKRQATIASGKLLLTSSADVEKAVVYGVTDFKSGTVDGYTAYIPYEGAYISWTPSFANETCTVKVNGTAVTNGSKLDAAALWQDEAGARQFTLTVTIENAEPATEATTYTVTCKELETLTVKTQPRKTTYVVGDQFDPTGMVVTRNGVGQEPQEVSLEDLTITPASFSAADENTIVTICYGAATTTLTVSVTPAFTQAGTKEDPFLLNNGMDLAKLSAAVAAGESYAGKYFKFTNNITLPANWTPIGSLKEGQTWTTTLGKAGFNEFSGTIDGDNHTLTVPAGSKTMLGAVSGGKLCNLNIYGEKIDGYGVVEYYYVDRANPVKVEIDNVTLKSGTRTKYSGFIGGYASGVDVVIIRNCTVEKGVVIGDDGTYPEWAAELIGEFAYPYGPTGLQLNDMTGSFGGCFNGTIENCVSHAKVYGRNYVGGILGFKGQSMGDCVVRDCTFDGEVIASGEYAGGIIGSGYASSSAGNTPCVTIQNCAVTGSVSGRENVGGIFGGNAFIMQCYNNGIGYIRGNYFAGTLKSSGEHVGGIIGYVKTLNRYNVIEGNYYLASSAEKGIGAIGNVETTNAQYKRLDDPTGADAAKLTDSFTAAEMADGTLVTKLNGASAGNAWTNGPTISSAKHVVRMTNKNLNSMTAGTYKQSGGMAQFENTKYDITVTYSDGSTEVIKVTQCQINGLDLNTAGYQLVTATYKGYAMMFGANVNADGAPSDETVTKPVISAIDRIGDVTLDSKEAIEAARAAYDALTDAQKVLVSNYETLVTAEKKLAELTNQAAVDDVANVINAIGPVSKDSGSAIQAARAAYNALTDAQKALVPADVLKKLTDAEAAYAALTTGTTGTGGGFGNSGKKDTTKTDAKNDAKTVKSGSTGDAGVTLYVGMALVAVLAGAAVVARKRKEN